jgi:gustatory receptor
MPLVFVILAKIVEVVMSVFEQLGPFVSLCQASGMIPFTKEQDLNSKKFAKFTFSLRHPITCWFILLLVLQLIISVGLVYSSTSQIKSLLIDPNMPIMMAVVFGVNWLSIFSQFLISRWVVLHYRQLRRAVESIQEVEKLFGDKFITQHKSSVMTRFIIGFILIVTTVSVPTSKLNHRRHCKLF